MSPAILVAVASLAAAPHAELIDFSTTWCGPCQQMKPIVEKLARQGFPVRTVNADNNRALARKYHVTGYPTFILLVNDKVVARQVGACGEAKLRQMLKLIPKHSAESRSQPEQSNSLGESAREGGWLPEFLQRDEPKQSASVPDNSVARGQSPEATSGPIAPVAATDPLQTAVRIRVIDSEGTDYGSGTIIGSKDGQALILTCWHIFRGFSQSDTIKIDVFPHGPDSKPKTFPGHFIQGKEKADVALVGITGCSMMPVSPISPETAFPQPEDVVVSVGCGKGRPDPTKLQHRVTRLNPFVGADTIECTGRPVIGRSGGGLFNAAGQVVGVCFAQERERARGVYAGPREVHALLQEAGFGALVPVVEKTELAETNASTKNTEIASAAESFIASLGTDGSGVKNPPQGDHLASEQDTIPGSPKVDMTSTKTGSSERPSLNPLDSSHASSVLSRLADGEIEATVVLRCRNRPDLPSQVIVINRVSDRFRRYLTGEVQQQPMETSLRTRHDETNDVAQLAEIFNTLD